LSRSLQPPSEPDNNWRFGSAVPKQTFKQDRAIEARDVCSRFVKPVDDASGVRAGVGVGSSGGRVGVGESEVGRSGVVGGVQCK
jgi:hypothetical protein